MPMCPSRSESGAAAEAHGPGGLVVNMALKMRVQVLGTVSNGYQIINRADVGGQYLNEWQTAKTTWVTTVRRFNTTPLPKTGY